MGMVEKEEEEYLPINSKNWAMFPDHVMPNSSRLKLIKFRDLNFKIRLKT